MRREGLKPEIAVWEDGLQTDTGSGSFEWWYFDAHFDDSSTTVMVNATKPLSLRDDALTPMITLTITVLLSPQRRNRIESELAK